MNLRDIIYRQQTLLADLEAQVSAHESADLYIENKTLHDQTAKLTASNIELRHQVDLLKEQNSGLSQALYSSALKERTQLINKSKERLQIYFGSTSAAESDKLSALEQAIMKRTDNIIGNLHQANTDTSHELFRKIYDFQQESAGLIQEAREKLASHAMLTVDDSDAYNQLHTDPLRNDQIVALAKKHSFERFIGLNLMSIVGIILIIIAAIFIGQFTVRQLTDAQRAIGIFVFGSGMLVAGEVFNRRKASVISLVVTSGGVAILYVALAFSYFALAIFGMITALVICVAITAVAFVLSTRYRSQLLLVLAFVGGHLPFFAIVMDPVLAYGLMVHFFILNLLVLLVSFKMKWTVSAFIGLGFNIIAVAGIVALGAGAPEVSNIVIACFIFFAFANYTAIPIIGTFVSRAKFKPEDVVLIAINTVASCATMYAAFAYFGWGDFMGLLALAYAIAYFVLALIFWKKFEDANTMRDLSALTGLVFFVLIIPLQLDVMWLSLGWLLQGLVMSLYGIFKQNIRVRVSGLVIFGLCVSVFVMVDFVMLLDAVLNPYFMLQYTSVTVASVAILAAFICKKTFFVDAKLSLSAGAYNGGLYKLYKALTIANVWVYMLYMVSQLSGRLYWVYPISAFYLLVMIQAVATWALAFGITRVKPLVDGGTRVLVVLMYAAGIVGVFVQNFAQRVVPMGIGSASPGVSVSATVIIVAVTGLSVFSLYDLLKQLVAREVLQPVYVQVVVSVYALVVITQNVILHYGVAFTNIWLSVFFVLSALGWVIYGFARRHTQLRRNGLALALLTVAKVFLLDLTGLSQMQRILSFLVMGALLIGIGYLYQFFIKRLEIKLQLPEGADDA